MISDCLHLSRSVFSFLTDCAVRREEFPRDQVELFVLFSKKFHQVVPIFPLSSSLNSTDFDFRNSFFPELTEVEGDTCDGSWILLTFGFNVSEFVFGVDVLELDFGVQVYSIEQPIKRNSVGSGNMSHCGAFFFNDHLDHCFFVFKHIQQSFLMRRLDVWKNTINIFQHVNLLWNFWLLSVSTDRPVFSVV